MKSKLIFAALDVDLILQQAGELADKHLTKEYNSDHILEIANLIVSRIGERKKPNYSLVYEENEE